VIEEAARRFGDRRRAGVGDPVRLARGDAAHARSDLDVLEIEPEVVESTRVRLCLRHWSGSTLAAASVSAFDITDQMGNSREDCMRTYDHTRSEDARARVRRVMAAAARKAS
jgi:hypothetical protein